MAKRVRKISDEMNNGMSKREASRKMQDERRRLQRRLAKELSEETGEKVSWKDAEKVYSETENKTSQIESLYSNIQETYTFKDESGKRGYTQDIKKLGDTIDTYSRMKYGSKSLGHKETEEELRQVRKDEMVRHQINQSTKKEGLSVYDANKSHAFYAATVHLWNDSENKRERNEAIITGLGVSSLEEAYELLTSEDLDFEEFGFETEEEFNEWLEDNIINELRDIIDEELMEKVDEKEVKYSKTAIANIRNRTDTLFNS